MLGRALTDGDRWLADSPVVGSISGGVWGRSTGGFVRIAWRVPRAYRAPRASAGFAAGRPVGVTVATRNGDGSSYPATRAAFRTTYTRRASASGPAVGDPGSS